jgi:hypothetical protein
MPRITISVVVLALEIGALTACDRPVNPLGPGLISSTPAATFSAQLRPQSLPLVPLLGFGCPSAFPFETTFDVVIGSATTDLFFRTVTLQPFDGFGHPGPLVAFNAIDVFGAAGSPLIPAGTTRSFGLHPQFGCGLSVPQSLAAEIVLADAFGSVRHLTLNAAFAHQ